LRGFKLLPNESASRPLALREFPVSGKPLPAQPVDATPSWYKCFSKRWCS
jgi:hypothetical protein